MVHFSRQVKQEATIDVGSIMEWTPKRNNSETAADVQG